MSGFWSWEGAWIGLAVGIAWGFASWVVDMLKDIAANQREILSRLP